MTFDFPPPLLFQDPVVIVSEDVACKPEVKAMCAELGVNMEISALVPPGTLYVYNPHGGKS